MKKIKIANIITYGLTAINIWLWGDILIEGIHDVRNIYEQGNANSTLIIALVIIPSLLLSLSVTAAFFYRRTGRVKIFLPAEILFLVIGILYIPSISGGGI